MKIKKVAKSAVKAAIWGTATYGAYVAGQGLQQIGKEMMRIPPLAGAGLIVFVSGEVMQVASLAPGLFTIMNTVDMGCGLVEKNEEEPK